MKDWIKLLGICGLGISLLFFLCNKNRTELEILKEKNKQVLCVNRKKADEMKKNVLPPSKAGVSIKTEGNLELGTIEKDMYVWNAIPDLSLNNRTDIWLENEVFFPSEYGKNSFHLYSDVDIANGGFQKIYESEHASLILSVDEGQFQYLMDVDDIFSANKTGDSLVSFKEVREKCNTMLKELGAYSNNGSLAVKGDYCRDSGQQVYDTPAYELWFPKTIDQNPIANMGCDIVYSQKGVISLTIGSSGYIGCNFKPNEKVRKLPRDSYLSGEEILKGFKKQIKKEQNVEVYSEYTIKGLQPGYYFTQGIEYDSGLITPCWILRVERKWYDFSKQKWEKRELQYFYSLDGVDVETEDPFSFLTYIRNWEEVRE